MHPDIEALIAAVRRAHPDVTVEQLQVSHPGADDDGLWFFRHPGTSCSVQVESSTGRAPFLIEHDHGSAVTASDVDQAVDKICERLGLTGQIR